MTRRGEGATAMAAAMACPPAGSVETSRNISIRLLIAAAVGARRRPRKCASSVAWEESLSAFESLQPGDEAAEIGRLQARLAHAEIDVLIARSGFRGEFSELREKPVLRREIFTAPGKRILDEAPIRQAPPADAIWMESAW